MRKLCIILLCLCFCGCARATPRPPRPVVTAITVTEVGSRPLAVQRFTTDQQTSAVLNYLRLLDIRGPAPVNPEQVAGPMYEIQLHFSDGSVTALRQKDDRYFLMNGTWRQIEPYSGARLTRILEE